MVPIVLIRAPSAALCPMAGGGLLRGKLPADQRPVIRHCGPGPDPGPCGLGDCATS